MSTTYAKSQSPAQKKDAPSASSVLDASSQSESLQRKADMTNNAAQRAEAPRPNNTGMPDNLKAGIESLSGFSMDDVRVHYNSSKPATVQALAYTQGTDIHVAPGQEKHLPHEAWHVAQQMAGRVSPTTNINGMPVNDNAALEHEADVMGEKAVQCKKGNALSKKCEITGNIIQCNIASVQNMLQTKYAPYWNAGTQTLTIPNGIQPYIVWRDLVNAFDASKENTMNNFVVHLVYTLSTAGCVSDIIFSQNEKGYVIAHQSNGHNSVINSHRGNPLYGGFVPFSDGHEERTSSNWTLNAISTPRFGGDDASKLIAERGRFQCLENVNSDEEPIVLFGRYGAIRLSPLEVWTSADSKMKKFRDARSAACDLLQYWEQTDDDIVERIVNANETLCGCVSELLEAYNQAPPQEKSKYVTDMKIIIKKLANAPEHHGYPYENDEIYYAITEFKPNKSGKSYFFSATVDLHNHDSVYKLHRDGENGNMYKRVYEKCFLGDIAHRWKKIGL